MKVAANCPPFRSSREKHSRELNISREKHSRELNNPPPFRSSQQDNPNATSS